LLNIKISGGHVLQLFNISFSHEDNNLSWLFLPHIIKGIGRRIEDSCRNDTRGILFLEILEDLCLSFPGSASTTRRPVKSISRLSAVHFQVEFPRLQEIADPFTHIEERTGMRKENIKERRSFLGGRN